MPSDNATTIQAIWRNNTDGNNAGFISGGKTIKQGEWAFVSFITELNSTWAAYKDLYVMFDTVGNGSVLCVDNISFAKVQDTFIGTWYYYGPDATFMGSDLFTGANLPAENGKVTFTLYNLNDINTSALIQLRASNWDPKTVGGATQNVLTVPAHGSATISLDVSQSGYAEDDFWIIYMSDGSTNVFGSEYVFGVEMESSLMNAFKDAPHMSDKGFYSIMGQVTNNEPKKGSVSGTFGNTIVYGVQDTLKAEVMDGCSFDGWYSGDSKLSADAEYAVDTTDIVSVPENMEVRFSGVPTPTAPVTTATPNPVKEVENGDAENGMTGWGIFSAAGGAATVVEGGANGTGHAVKFVPTGEYDSIAFDLGPAIVQNEEAGYQGKGAGKYRITFWAKVDGTVPENTKFNVVLNSQAHESDAKAIAEKYGIAAEEWYTNTYITGSAITMTGEWKQYSAVIEVSENFLKTLDAIYGSGEKGARAYELILRLDGSQDGYAFKGKTPFAYLVDEVTIGEAKEPAGVEWKFTKDYSGSVFICSENGTGFITAADVKDGKVKKSFTVYNNGTEDIQLQFSASVMHQGTPQAWVAVKNTEWAKIPAGSSLLIEYECDAKAKINANGLEKEYTYEEFFPRFDIKNGEGGTEIKAGTSFIVAGLNTEILQKLSSNAKDSMTVTEVYELPTSSRPGGDLLPIGLIVAVVTAAAVLVVVARRKKEEQ